MKRIPVAYYAALAAIVMAACAQVPTGQAPNEPAHLEPVSGSDVQTITLTSRAAERLAIRTVAAGTPGTGAGATASVVVPHSAIFYTSDGTPWIYLSPEPLVFVREPVHVLAVAEGQATLAGGEPGMMVVTVGAAELYGAETGLGAGAH